MEAVSLVLSVFPLLITTVEHWESCMDSTKRFFRWKNELQNTSIELSVQELKFRMNLQSLLAPIVPKADIMEMIDNPKSDLWKPDGETGIALARKLGDASSHYQRIVRNCERILRELAEAFDCVLKNDTWRYDVSKDVLLENLRKHGTTKNIATSVKFLYRKKSILQLIQELDKNNQRLTELEDKADKIGTAIATSKTKLKPFLRHFTSVRQTALTLHKTLAKHITCSSHVGHSIKLELADPNVEYLSRKRPIDETRSMQFKLLFVAHNHKSEDQIRLFQLELTKEAHVSVEGDEDQGQVDRLSVDMVAESKGKTAKLRFSVPLKPDNVYAATTPRPGTLAEVRSLCDSAIQLGNGDFCLDLRVLRSKLLHNIDHREGSTVAHFDRVVSLYELIRMHHNQNFPFHPRTRRAISLKIAASLLRFHTSPWINEAFWSSKEVFVAIRKDGYLSDPYLSTSFLDEPRAGCDSNGGTPWNDPNSRGRTRHKNPALLALGVLLLELELGKPIEALVPDLEDGADKSESRTALFIAANKVLETREYQETVSDNHLLATESCINCAFTMRYRRFSDEKFREAFCEEVILPILRDYCHENSVASFEDI
ncbi:hypothetical protein BJ508DRAFT_323489 [Ascobolus immersus RN42]|uniref:DUF7580 domain-containing protein n=1 Tax=Ascobolus immersus RN42 TaxID=1160509 RepID=A0A3N4IKC3_ASCIM|nr:hypothetical protein BJ508DRAFT_323489 [Ascobolus immersus RN42]